VSDPATVVAAVEDPELPFVTIGELGMVRSVEVSAHQVNVVLTPTYTGCPATEQIRDDVVQALQAHDYEAVVEFEMSPAWSTDHISARGLAKLKAAGIAPPGSAKSGVVVLDTPVRCPQCGSLRTRLQSAFGATACKALYRCNACRQPFESFKAI